MSAPVERCSDPSCSEYVKRIDGARCGGVLFGTRESAGGCGRFFCSDHLVGRGAGPFFCDPCWQQKKQAPDLPHGHDAGPRCGRCGFPQAEHVDGCPKGYTCPRCQEWSAYEKDHRCVEVRVTDLNDPRHPRHGPACAEEGCGDGQMLHHLQSGSCMVIRDGVPCACRRFVSSGSVVEAFRELREAVGDAYDTDAAIERLRELRDEVRWGPGDGYDALRDVLRRAVEQAARGKGRERHAAAGEPFHEQQIVKLCVWSGSPGFAIGQACKKALESQRLDAGRAVAELLGAINYLAAAVIVRELELKAQEEPA